MHIVYHAVMATGKVESMIFQALKVRDLTFEVTKELFDNNFVLGW